jgi:hypothetical protein
MAKKPKMLDELFHDSRVKQTDPHALCTQKCMCHDRAHIETLKKLPRPRR